MKSSFGRRIVGPRGHDLVLIEGTGDDAPLPHLVQSDIKERIWTLLMSRIDPTAAGRLPRPTLTAELAKLVGEIATQERIDLNENEENALATEFSDDMIGLGPLEPFLDDDGITDILVNGPFSVYVERQGKLELTSAKFRNVQHVVNVAQRIAAAVGRRIDESSPMVDARLADGSRVHIALAPIVLNGGTISIRKFPKQNITLDVMVRQGNLSPAMVRFLQVATQVRASILISGGTGSGKTTLLNAVSRFIGAGERIITIEDAVELRLQQPHVVQMETRTANIEGVGAIPQRELVRNALRMRPDRIIVGEVRGAEAFDMLQAMNTGHDGSMGTIHANTPRDALSRLESMVLMASVNLPLQAIRAQIASAINLVVQVERMRDGVRRVERIVEISGMEGQVITARDLFTFQYSGQGRDGILNGTFEPSGLRPDLASRAAQYGLEKTVLEAVGIAGD
jgi:pilus assembly protein CpaF